jgi:hypothetical protein
LPGKAATSADGDTTDAGLAATTTFMMGYVYRKPNASVAYVG